MSDVTELAWLKVQVPAVLADALKERARRHERSISGEMRLALKAHLEDELDVGPRERVA